LYGELGRTYRLAIDYLERQSADAAQNAADQQNGVEDWLASSLADLNLGEAVQPVVDSTNSAVELSITAHHSNESDDTASLSGEDEVDSTADQMRRQAALGSISSGIAADIRDRTLEALNNTLPHWKVVPYQTPSNGQNDLGWKISFRILWLP